VKITTTKLLQGFLGKVCTIFTSATNRDFAGEVVNSKEYQKITLNYFMGRIESIDEDGILISQLNGINPPLKSYFFLPQVIMIAEEKEYNPDDPQDAEEIKKLEAIRIAEKTKAENSNLNTANASEFVNPEALNEMVEKLNNQFES